MGEKTAYINQAKMALEYMQQHGSITSEDARYYLGISSFPKRICQIKEMGYEVDWEWVNVINRWGRKCHVKKYWLVS